MTVYRRRPVGKTNLDGPFADFWSVETFLLEIQPFVRALVFFPMIFDLIPARHLDISSIGYLLLSKSTAAGSAVSGHLDTRWRFSEHNSSYRTATELILTETASERSGAFVCSI